MATAKKAPKKVVKPVVVPARDKLDAAGESTIIELITQGVGYRAIAREYGVSIGSLFTWINKTSERSHACANARALASHSEDELALEDIIAASDNFELSKAKEIAIHRRWRAKSLNPQKYGDKVGVELAGRVTLDNAPIEELSATLKSLLEKMG